MHFLKDKTNELGDENSNSPSDINSMEDSCLINNSSYLTSDREAFLVMKAMHSYRFAVGLCKVMQAGSFSTILLRSYLAKAFEIIGADAIVSFIIFALSH